MADTVQMRPPETAGSASGDPAIAFVSVDKRFGRGGASVQALEGLSLSIPQGSVYGLLGPNGAG